jgi:transposase-like protein
MVWVTYTDEQKAEALALYDQVGAANACRLLDFEVSPGTVRVWAHRAGLKRYDSQKVEAAVAAHVARQAELREEMRELALSSAVEMLLRLYEPQFVGYNDEGEALFAKPGARDCQAYATAYGILNDKYRLEMGESTSRTETLDASRVDIELARTVEEWRIQAANADSE